MLSPGDEGAGSAKIFVRIRRSPAYLHATILMLTPGDDGAGSAKIFVRIRRSPTYLHATILHD